MGPISITHDLEYLLIFSLVLILPKILIRFKIPSGITALLIGCIVGALDPNVKTDQLFRFLAQIGITSLFVFSGLEVNLGELKEDRSYLFKYISKSILILIAISFGFVWYFDLSFQISLILALGVFTPSAGFIINSLHSYNIGEDQEYWVKSKSISKEILSVFILFFALQFHDVKAMGLSLVFYAGLIIFLPYIFKLFFKFISPYAPNSEVPFLVVISLISGVISKELGAYYLVGAFLVGLIGSRFKEDIFHENEEVIFTALSSFFNVFLPFYFFYTGLKISFSGFTSSSILIGAVFLVAFIPLRLLLNIFSLKYALADIKLKTTEIAMSLMPTLIFGLVIAGFLLEKEVPEKIIYGLIFYTLLSSLVPTFVFGIKNLKKKG